jgi:hypothetical protein
MRAATASSAGVFTATTTRSRTVGWIDPIDHACERIEHVLACTELGIELQRIARAFHLDLFRDFDHLPHGGGGELYLAGAVQELEHGEGPGQRIPPG